MTRRSIAAGFAWALCAFIVSTPAFAQSEEDFVRAFSGNWETLDPAFSNGGACRMALGPAKTDQGYLLKPTHCGGTLAGLVGWRIVEGQLALIKADGAVAARLGGNQNRVSGDTASAQPVILERLPAETTQSAAPPRTDGCVFYGYTAACATEADLATPKPGADSAPVQVSVLVRLNARAEARPDAPVLATVPANTCVPIEQCTTASDGVWCRAKISTYSAWIRQRAIRQDQWPVLTFANGC